MENLGKVAAGAGVGRDGEGELIVTSVRGADAGDCANAAALRVKATMPGNVRIRRLSILQLRQEFSRFTTKFSAFSEAELGLPSMARGGIRYSF